MKSTELWFIRGTWRNGNPFFYCGGKLTRKDAIAAHVAGGRRTWEQCKRNGDRAVKCRIVPVTESLARRT